MTGRPAQTVFFGGGTPTLLPAADLVKTLHLVRDRLGLADDAEITTEANPESVDQAYLAELREGGFTRVSLGMQSARAARTGAARASAHAGPGRGGGRGGAQGRASSTSTST